MASMKPLFLNFLAPAWIAPVMCPGFGAVSAGGRTSDSRCPGQTDLGTSGSTKHHHRFNVYMASVAD